MIDTVPFPEYPRPMLHREGWYNLNGWWDCAFTADAELPPAEAMQTKILVPYSPECEASGVGRTLQPGESLHYHRTFVCPVVPAGGRLLLHFGAVDYTCTVRVNDHVVGSHRGGYWPFSLDITEALCPGMNDLWVTVQDPTGNGVQARGKQTLTPGGMFYPAQSGIWQTVWLEPLQPVYITDLRLMPDYDSRTVTVQLKTNTPAAAAVEIFADGVPVAKAELDAGIEKIILAVPEAAFHPWSPESPFLYTVTATLAVGDRVESYFALRSWQAARDGRGVLRFFLNGKPILLNGLLDQGYWPQGLYTPPSDAAVVKELEQVKALGFNLLRKHAKIEPQRWYYHCDRLGLVVWQDMVSGGTPSKLWFVTYLTNVFQPLLRKFPDGAPFYGLLSRPDAASRDLYREELNATVDALACHPCIGCWVPFNEGWGQFDAAKATARLRVLDPGRLIDEASGWFDQGGGDVDSRHNYFYPLRVRPGRRTVALTEYGGIAFPVEGHLTADETYGYGTARDSADMAERYEKLQCETVLPQLARGLSALVYTQLTDVEEEVNGLFTYDRAVLKLPADRVRAINDRLYAAFDACVRSE